MEKQKVFPLSYKSEVNTASLKISLLVEATSGNELDDTHLRNLFLVRIHWKLCINYLAARI